MINLCSTLLFLISVGAFAGTAQTNNLTNIGDAVNSANAGSIVPNSNLSSQTCIIAAANPAGDITNYYGFYSMNAPVSQSQYQVPTGQTFYATSYTALSGSINFQRLGYGMGILAAEGTTTPPLTPIYFSSGVAASAQVYIPTAANTYYTWHHIMSFPSQSFPFAQNVGATNFTALLCGLVQ